ncbi:site-specific integrase [Halobaculum halobium]|uniref:site-specific integrase n=1 Tax=Halobaculum halobium TaxID=3032281 RepID=UPI00360DBE6B
MGRDARDRPGRHQRGAQPAANEHRRGGQHRAPRSRAAASTIREFRSQPVGASRATLQHVLLELEWWTGARMSALRGIDMEDVDLDEGTIEFYHRPDTGTPIKQAHNPERKVGLADPAVDVLRDYVREVRDKVRDEHRRRPLLTTAQGRASKTTIRRYTYFATLPCQSVECPHDREPGSCEWMSLRAARSCPSARSPHAVRTGAISNLRNSGWDLDDVAERVNTGPKRLIQHYDFPTMDEQYRERRADLVDLLRLDDEDDSANTQDDDQ